MAAHLFIEQGHGIVLHARNQKRGREALAAVLGAEKVGGGDLSGVAQTRNVAEQVNALSSFGAVIGCSLHAPEPGWVATKMGGVGAPDTGDAGHLRCWVAVSDDPAAAITGEYFYHLQRRTPNPAARDVRRQEQLLDACKHFSGEDLPTN